MALKNHVETLHIAPDSPWENGYIESFNDKLRDDALNCELFHSVKEAKSIVEKLLFEYNNHRPHSSLDYMTTGCLRGEAQSTGLCYAPPAN